MNFSNNFVCEDYEYSTYEKSVSAPIFRKSFNLVNQVDRAELLICGLGFYDLFVNGIKITKGYLAPYISNTDHIIYYDYYDIKIYLKNGENVVGVMLGDGNLVGKTITWDFKNNITNSAPMLALSMEIESEGKEFNFDASDFVCKKGPIIFNDLRSGVFYDARLEDNWLESGYDDSDWKKPLLASKPRGYAKLCEAEPIKIYKEIKPVSVTKGEIFPYKETEKITTFEKACPINGGYIYDFGENNSGIFRLKIKGERGQKISLQCAEQLTDGKVNYNNINYFPDGFCQRDIYYLKGGEIETFEPMFTYHGFRYIYVSGITEEQATQDLLTYLVMSSDIENRGSFECSDEIANKIYNMGRTSDISNFFYFPVDCPHREKNGWTGDASVSAEQMIMNIGVENSWREWLANIRMAQKENGQIPGIVPTGTWGYEWGNGPAWDSVLFNLPYFAYKYRGNTQIIKENVTAMFRYLEYIISRRDKNGIVSIGLGDWVPAGKENSGDYDASIGFTDSTMVLDMCRKSAEMFGAVNLPYHKAFAETIGNDFLEAIRREYIDFDTFIVKNKCQTSQAMAIFYNVFTNDEKNKAFNALMDIIKEDNYNFTCGFLGLRVIFHVLSDFGQAELAYKMITKPDFPSYGYWVKKGENTLLEHFLSYDKYYLKSKNHHFLGDVINWFISSIGGIKVQNCKLVNIDPHFILGMDWCKVSHSLPSGSIQTYWKRISDGIELTVTVEGDVKYNLLDKKFKEFAPGKYFVKEE